MVFAQAMRDGNQITPYEPDPKPRVVLPDESRYSASAADGQGSASVEPAVVEVSSPVTIVYTFTVAASGIAVGGGVTLSVSKFWSWAVPQTTSPQWPAYTRVECSNAAVKLAIQDLPQQNVVLVRIAGETPLVAGDRITFTYGDTSGGKYPQAQGISDFYAERGERFFIKVDGDGDGFFTPIAKQATFQVQARHARQLKAFIPSQITVGEPFDVAVAALDGTFNLVETFRGQVRIEAIEGKIEPVTKTRFDADDRGTLGIPIVATEPGVVRLGVSDMGGKLLEAVTNPSLASASSKRSYFLYWGDLQIHSNVSDGTGTPADIYRYARDVAGLDVAVLTDHDHWGYQPLDTDPVTWQNILKTSVKFNKPGAFVTFPGYEWTNWTFGHRHVLFRYERDATIFSWQDPRSDSPEKLWKLLGDRDCLTIPHHCGGGPVPIFWKYHNPKYEPVVEMASVHGVSEMMGHPRCIYSPVASGMAQAALARGYRLGMIGSGDTHDGLPGLGSPGHRAGLVGIYAKELTRDAIFEALRARRVYATTGCRAILRFNMNGTKMGSVRRLTDVQTARTITVSVLGDAPIDSITIVKNNDPVVTVPGTGAFSTLTWTDPAAVKNGDYYYARIKQTDDEWIWSSPIWIELGG